MENYPEKNTGEIQGDGSHEIQGDGSHVFILRKYLHKEGQLLSVLMFAKPKIALKALPFLY